MTIDDIREQCLAKREVTEELPFDDTTLVYKVAGKMFALTSLKSRDRVSLKCDPDLALELRAEYDSVTPGYHLDKKHWITVLLDGSVRDDDIAEWINNSYNLVVDKLPKKQRLLIRDEET